MTNREFGCFEQNESGDIAMHIIFIAMLHGYLDNIGGFDGMLREYLIKMAHGDSRFEIAANISRILGYTKDNKVLAELSGTINTLEELTSLFSIYPIMQLIKEIDKQIIKKVIILDLKNYTAQESSSSTSERAKYVISHGGNKNNNTKKISLGLELVHLGLTWHQVNSYISKSRKLKELTPKNIVTMQFICIDITHSLLPRLDLMHYTTLFSLYNLSEKEFRNFVQIVTDQGYSLDELMTITTPITSKTILMLELANIFYNNLSDSITFAKLVSTGPEQLLISIVEQAKKVESDTDLEFNPKQNIARGGALTIAKAWLNTKGYKNLSSKFGF
jgi:hypothetical protein